MGEKTPGAILGLHLWNCEATAVGKRFECIETLNIGGESIDLYQEMERNWLRTLVELLRR